MSGLWALGPDERNAAIHKQARGMSYLEDVREESARVFTALMEQLELLPEEAYQDAARFTDMPPEWEPWKLIAGNTDLALSRTIRGRSSRLLDT